MSAYFNYVSLLWLFASQISYAQLEGRPLNNAITSVNAFNLSSNSADLTLSGSGAFVQSLANGSIIEPTDLTSMTKSNDSFGDISADVEVLDGQDGASLHPLIVPATAINGLNISATSGTVIPVSRPDLTSRNKIPRNQHRRLSNREGRLEPRRNEFQPYAGVRLSFRIAHASAAWLTVTLGNLLPGRDDIGISAHEQLWNIVGSISQHLYQVVDYENYGPNGDMVGAQAVYGRQTSEYVVHNNAGTYWYFQAIGDDATVVWDEIRLVWDTIISLTWAHLPQARDCLVPVWTLYEGNPDQGGVQLAHGTFTQGIPHGG